MRRWGFAFALFVLAAVVGSTVWGQAATKTSKAPVPSYIGATKCKACHMAPAKGNQWKNWTESQHAKAFATLGTAEALAAAQKLGIATAPQETPKCLACHVTGYSAPAEQKQATYKADEGVTCEACHGPGSEYKDLKVMQDQAAAVAKGLIVPNEKTCTKCHNADSPTFKGFTYAEMVKKVSHPNPLAKKAAETTAAPPAEKEKPELR
jgi:hypothetical protein